VGSADALADADAAALAPFAGKIIPGAAFPVVQNRSSYDVALSVAVRVTGDAVPVATSAAVEPATGAAATANNILLNVQLQEAAIITDIATAPAFAAATSPVAVALTATAQSLNFVLGGAAYVANSTDGVAFTYTRVATDFGFGTALQLEGEINKNANWTAFTGATPASKVGVDAKFSVARATVEDIALPAVTGAYGYKGIGLFTPPGPTLGWATATGTSAAGQWSAWIDFEFGSYTVTSIAQGTTSPGTALTSAQHQVNTTNGQIRLNFASAGVRTIRVTLSNTEVYTFVLTTT
jgi:hypothetical protein